MRPRVLRRCADRQQTNAALVGLPVTDYLNLPRRDRKRLLRDARRYYAEVGR